MKKIYILLIACFASFAASSGLYAQSVSLEIKKTDQSMVRVATDDIRKLTFGNEQMTIHYLSGTQENIGIDLINSIRFGLISGLRQAANLGNIRIYPNPATTQLNIDKAANKRIQIMSISGVRLLDFRCQSELAQIDISFLTQGVYLLKLDNQTVKFTKL